MARNLEKNIKEADTYLSKHLKRDLKVSEIEQLKEMFMTGINKKGFYQGLFDLICNAWLFGFSAGRKAGMNDSKR